MKLLAILLSATSEQLGESGSALEFVLTSQFVDPVLDLCDLPLKASDLRFARSAVGRNHDGRVGIRNRGTSRIDDYSCGRAEYSTNSRPDCGKDGAENYLGGTQDGSERLSLWIRIFVE